MGLLAIVIVLVAACGGGDDMPVDRHAPATCDAAWLANGFDQCEAACADSTTALNAHGPPCSARTVPGNAVNCSSTFEFGGVTGCCASQTPQVLFADCQ